MNTRVQIQNFQRRWLWCIAVLFLQTCIDPVVPEYDYKTDIIFIDAYATTEEGSSYVKIERSNIVSDIYQTDLVFNAKVRIENMDDGRWVSYLENDAGLYVPTSDFKVNTGEKWRLHIQLEDGRKYESEVEEVTKSVEIENIAAEYKEEAIYLDSEQEFVPGHQVNIRFSDPAGESNYYLWRYKTFETLEICKTCIRGRFRNGKCENNTFRFRNFDYMCEVPCWYIRYGDAFELYNDQFSDGRSNINRPIAILPLWTRENIVIEFEQLILNQAGYEFYQIIGDVLNESSGLNAPPPASLLGNLYNPEDINETVLGQFNAVAQKTYSLFIERSDIKEIPLEPIIYPALEDPADINSVFYAPCEESKVRTSIRPEGWK